MVQVMDFIVSRLKYYIHLTAASRCMVTHTRVFTCIYVYIAKEEGEEEKKTTTYVASCGFDC